jgi:hypothetical protein
MSEYSKSNMLYGVWLHGQIKSLVDQAHSRKSEIPANQKADVESALAELEKVLGKLQPHQK